ncbi:PhoH family protein [Pseudodesulfovibrio profundus]|uniref:PhoH family protein n=1 Tax=Pseudodesulfovibrio profundus TaxID=57320 RepID=A0A2C8F9L8_9BACT|nr:PhoH family protein [Pseudodesulfovibrio profundus]MBC17731.1 phosphate starvation-inducible protein PhoH [Desulfovibrio sp.]SOB59134.1 PhoH family protein [Pseudodesulfovibrio profundus]|tara:strand:- start:11688 stop:12878 length:1191 start_codon:yes stop_codon:yes gene_type:complete
MAQKHFVLDTNVLIENPKCITALRNGAENKIYIPYTVLTELDGLKKDPRIGHIVSQAVRAILDDDQLTIFPPDFALTLTDDVMDDRILKEILHMAPEEGTLITNDRILQIKASCYGIPSEEYRDSDPFRSESQRYTGFVDEGDPPENNCFMWEAGTPVFHGPEGPKPINYTHEIWGVKPRSVYQNLALELMLQEGIDLISIQSEAGYGKTFLSLAAALYLMLERKDNPYRKIYLVKPVVEIGSKMGYLPGDIEEKMLPYIKYVQDLLIKLHDIRPCNRLWADPQSETLKFNRKRIEVQPVAFIRGMNIENAVVIVDEMQNLSRGETRALLTRMGEGVKCICLGDTRQVDHPYLNESNNGLNWTVRKLKGYKNYAHMVLKGDRSRGPITDIVLKSKL